MEEFYLELRENRDVVNHEIFYKEIREFRMGGEAKN